MNREQINQPRVCLDKENFGECTKKEDCEVCNRKIENQLDSLNINVLNLNKNAKGYVPKSKRQDTNTVSGVSVNTNSNVSNDNRLNFNLQAKEYVPKIVGQEKDTENRNYNQNDEEMADDDAYGEEFDMIMKDIINNEALEEMEDEDESDDEKWFPKYKDCECCKGFVYKCKGIACMNMNVCYCKVKDECDEEDGF